MKGNKNQATTVQGTETSNATSEYANGSVKIEPAKRKPGRPVVPGSARQQKLAAKGTEVRFPGRPVDPNSARQIKLAEQAAKRAAGQVKMGRPPMTEEEKAAAKVIRDAKKRELGLIK